MNRKHLRKVVDTFGLQLVSFENGTGNGANIVLRAPDGHEGRFMVNRLDDPNSDRINEAQFRRFARDHATSRTLPGVDEIDMRMTDMQRALIAAHEKAPVESVRVVQRLLSQQPLLNPEGVIREAMAHPESDDNPLQVWVHDGPNPFKPSVQEDPIDAPIETIEALIESEPQPKKESMPRKLTLAKPTMTTDTPPAKPKRRQIMRIGQVEFFKLCTVLNDIDMIGINSLVKLADKLTKAYGSPVAVSTAEDALKATGKKLDKVQVDATDAQIIIAKTLTALLIKLSEPVPEELRKLCGEIE